ncbi:hypothetical protein CI102_8134 [Trichoderma harzianum]|nr:hypothetical protein CI102_8134 [Trichoderma harzianum]
MATPQFVCANWSADNTGCKKFGKYTCNVCHLVVYCGSDCQKSHWALHKIDCKSPLGNEAWRPGWVLERRDPKFMVKLGSIYPSFAEEKRLWGNIPAIDGLQLESNEGVGHGKQLNLLFAASGDLRNVVKTIAQVPDGYTKPIEVTINDNDLDVVARNAIILLIALVSDNADEAVDCIIHVWYSALIRKSDLDMLQQKTWRFEKGSLRLVLPKSFWDRLLAYVSIPEGLTADQASCIRTAVTLARSKRDYLDLHLIFQSPSRRVAKQRFRQDGLLLPFGAPRHEFQEPNPTLFHVRNVWPMASSADPLQGWSLKDVEDSSSGPASADIYGKLYNHIHTVLRAFLSRITDSQVSFRLFCDTTLVLTSFLESGYFDRIEVRRWCLKLGHVSNMSDNCFNGIHQTLFLIGFLLQPPLANPHATLITLFRNAIPETLSRQDVTAALFTDHPETRLMRASIAHRAIANGYEYLPDHHMSDPKVIQWVYAQANLSNYDAVFERFMMEVGFSELKELFRVVMKEKHTVIEKWPFRSKLRHGQPGAMEEFVRLNNEVVFAKDRYVEWRRC